MPARLLFTHVILLLTEVEQALSVHVAMSDEKPTSLPPALTVTRFVPLFKAPIWLLMTSTVVAPLHATKFKVYAFAVATMYG